MANITAIKGKDGKITGYRIRIFLYEDSNGKKQFYSQNWTIPPTFKSEKAIQKGLQEAVSALEAEHKSGKLTKDNSTFIEYARYYIDTKELKAASKRFYTSLLPFIEPEIGYIKLKNLTPEHLDTLYRKLQTADVKRDAKATATDHCVDMLNNMNMKRKDQATAIGICENALRECLKKNHVAVGTAEKVAAYFQRSVKDLFVVSSSSVGLSAKTIGHIHSFINAVLQFAVKKGALAFNVAMRAEPPKKEKHEAEFFEISEAKTILDALEKEPLKYKMMVYLLTFTGCRRGELFGLRWQSIDFDAETIRFDRNVQYIDGQGIVIGTPKSNKARTISIKEDDESMNLLLPLLQEYKQEQELYAKIKFSTLENAIERRHAIRDYNPEGYLFIQDNGEVMTPNALNAWCVEFSKKVGLHVHPHKFRHSHASILIAAGVDIVTVSKRMGHTQVSTTSNIYAHMLEQSDRNAATAFSTLISRRA